MKTTNRKQITWDEAVANFPAGTPVIFVNACNKAKRAEVVEVFMDEEWYIRVKVRYYGEGGTWYDCSPHVERVGTLDAFE